ncbi:MAG TPA: YjbH domain-containing protein [Synergistaceae bacterium]|nr:YjbH domain-containing protein [Synergistaceae bacterium]
MWEYPTAEILDDGVGWFGYNETYPYNQLYIALGYLPNVELNLRATNFLNGPWISSDFGHYKDKGFDAKYRIKEQDGIWPSIAVGVTDLSGTELLRAYFGVGTYRFDNVAVSLGWGSDRLGGIFGGVEWQPYSWLTLKAEYNSIDYNEYPFHEYEEISKDSDYNYGAIISTPWNLDLNVSYQRGDELCIGVRYNFDLKKPIFGGHKERLKGLPINELPSWDQTDPNLMITGIANTLSKELPVKDVQVLAGEKRLLITYENIGYSSEAEAMGRVLYLVSSMIPWDIESVSLVPKVRGVAASRVDIPGDHCALLRLGELRREYLVESRAYWTNPDNESGILKEEKWAFSAVPTKEPNDEHTFKVMPVYELQALRGLNDYYMDRTSLDFIYEWHPKEKRGTAGVVDVRVPLYNDIELTYQPYVNDETRIWQAIYSQMHKIDANSFELSEVGWLDQMWFGINYSRRTYFQNGRWWTGFKAGIIHERDPYSFGSLSDYRVALHSGISPYIEYGDNEGWWAVGLLQGGYRFPELDFEVSIDAGVYADGDSGGTVMFMRHWDDIGIGFWGTRTSDVSKGEDFTNSGIYLEIPLDTWRGKRSKHIWTQKARIQGWFDPYAGREADWWQSPDLLWGQLNPDRLLYNLYEELEQGQRLVKELEGQK